MESLNNFLTKTAILMSDRRITASKSKNHISMRLTKESPRLLHWAFSFSNHHHHRTVIETKIESNYKNSLIKNEKYL